MFLFAVTFPVKKGKTVMSHEDLVHISQMTCTTTFNSFFCTLTTTSLIVYRIYPIFRQDHSRGGFKKIFDILIQSAAAYALTSLLDAILLAVAASPTFSGESTIPAMYTDTLFAITAVCPVHYSPENSQYIIIPGAGANSCGYSNCPYA